MTKRPTVLDGEDLHDFAFEALHIAGLVRDARIVAFMGLIPLGFVLALAFAVGPRLPYLVPAILMTLTAATISAVPLFRALKRRREFLRRHDD